jgi:putative spermidine/putrescine transport system permease protein
MKNNNMINGEMRKNKLNLLIVVLICGYLLLPIVIAFIYSISSSWADILPESLSLKHYAALMKDERFMSALIRTVGLCLSPIIVGTLIVLLALFSELLYFPTLGKYVQILCVIPYALQGIVLSVSILSIFAGMPTFLGNRAVMLSGAYCILILPYLYQGLRNAFYAINFKTLIEVASTLGAGRYYACFTVIVPNLIPGIVVSALLSMSAIITDFVLVSTIGGSNFENVQMFLFKILSYSSGKSGATFIIIFLMVMIITFFVLQLQNKLLKKQEV